MSIWKDLLFLGGHIATPTGLAAAAPEIHDAPDAHDAHDAHDAPTPVVAERRTRPALRPSHVSPNDLGW